MINQTTSTMDKRTKMVPSYSQTLPIMQWRLAFGFFLLLLYHSSTESPIIQIDIKSPITKILPDKHPSQVIVGGVNFVAVLEMQMEEGVVLFHMRIGPVTSEKDCYPNPAPCPNVVQVLEFDETFSKLVVCGSAYGGTCTMHFLDYLCDWSCLDAITNTSTSNALGSPSGHQVVTQFLSRRETEMVFDPFISEEPWDACRGGGGDATMKCNSDDIEILQPPPSNTLGMKKRSVGYSDGKNKKARRRARSVLSETSGEDDPVTNNDNDYYNIYHQQQTAPVPPGVFIEEWDYGKTFESRWIVAGHKRDLGMDIPQEPMISMRYVSHMMEESYLMVHPGEKGQMEQPGIYVDKDKVNDFSVDFKMIFTRGSYSYLLNVQDGQCSLPEQGSYHKTCTMLSRVDVSSPSLLPYIEIPLMCEHDYRDYPLLTAATLGVSGLYTGSVFEEVPVLILAFGRGDYDDTEPNPDYGTAICAHSLHSLDNEEFDYIAHMCSANRTSGFHVPMWSSHTDRCQMTRPDSFGQTQRSVHFIPNALVSTLLTHTQATITETGAQHLLETINVYAVTQHSTTFKLKKYFEMKISKTTDDIYNLEYTTVPKHEQKTILEEPVSDTIKYPPVGIVDNVRAILRLTYGSRVYALNLDFCRQYTRCGTCHKNGGKKCRWCPSSKTCMDKGLDSCRGGLSPGSTCPPKLTTFVPKSIPVSGGSTLTLTGKHLGDTEVTNVNVTVTICGQPCDNVVAAVNSLTCTVREKPSCPFCETCVVHASVTGSIDSRGHGFTASKLTYVTPNISLFSPLYGPVSGGTLLEVWGEHLLSGSQRRVEVAGVPCDVLPLEMTEESEEKLMCMMNKASDDLENQCGKVKVMIDSYEIEASTFEYCFKPDPIITSIKPMYTIESGGVVLHVYGKHFNSTPYTQLNIAFTSANKQQNQQLQYRGTCVKESSEQLKCTTPNIRNATKHIFEDDRQDMQEIQASVTLDIGGTRIESSGDNYFFIQRDPIIFHLSSDSTESLIHNGLKDKLFPILGKYIPYWMDKDDIVIMVGNTRCPTIRVETYKIFCDITEVLKAYKKDYREMMKSTTTTTTIKTTSSLSNTTVASAPISTVKATTPLSPTTTTSMNTITFQPDSFNVTNSPDQIYGDNTTSLNLNNSDNNIPRFQDFKSRRAERIRNKPIIKQQRQPITYPIKIQLGNWKQNLGFVSVGRLLSASPEPDTEKPAAASTWIFKLVGIIAGTIVALVIIPIIVCFVCYRRQVKSQMQDHPFYMGSLSGRSGGGSQPGSGEPAIPTLAQILHTVLLDPSKREAATKLIVDPDQLTLGIRVGSGNFGCVYMGMVSKGKEGLLKVAVKTLQDPVSHSINLAEFVQEAIIMMDFSHENVLGLVGLAEKEPGVPYVILPYMENGDLSTYVKDPKRGLSLYDVIQFAADICSGMSYLSSLKFVHRDLAARNCMLDMYYRVKVADFGLCRDIYEKGYYTSDNKKKLPIRWMALESIENGAYSTKSDVWSMGVVLWELLMRGMTPYPGVDGWDIITFLQSRRLSMPYYCPHKLYRLMMNCWTKDPARRPSFKALEKELLLMIGMESVTTPNTPEATRHMKVQHPLKNNRPANSLPYVVNKTDDEPDYLIPKITISKDNLSLSDHSSVGRGCDDEKSQSDLSKCVAGSVMSLPTSNLVTNVKIIFPTCNKFKDMSDEAVATYIQILDTYEPPPKFHAPFLRSKKKRNKSSKKSKDKNSKESKALEGCSRTSGGGGGDNSLPRYSKTPSGLPITRRLSDGQLIDENSGLKPMNNMSHYHELEHNQRASDASILSRSCTSSVFDKTCSWGSVSMGCSGASSMASLASAPNVPLSSPRHSNRSSKGSNQNFRHERSSGRVSPKVEDIIEI